MAGEQTGTFMSKFIFTGPTAQVSRIIQLERGAKVLGIKESE